MPKNIVGGGVSVDAIARIGESDAERLSRHRVVLGDIIFGRRGDIGRHAFVREREVGWLCGTGCLLIRVGKGPVDPRFLHYYLDQDSVIRWLENHAVGATMANLNTSILRSIPITFPSVAEQDKVASILSAYDDLIENNLRRIQILEELAQALYREWFVELRFPGNRDPAVAPPWPSRPIGEVLSGHIGGGWGQEEQSTEHPVAAYVIRGTDIPSVTHLDVSSCPRRYHKASNLRSRRLEPGDVVFEVSGGSKDQSLGRMVLVSGDLLRCFAGEVMCASFCKRLTPDPDVLLPELLWMNLHEFRESGEIVQYEVQSTGIKNFSFKAFLTGYEVLVPPPELQARFVALIAPMLSLSRSLGARNAVLRKARDLLLPRLISGELDVSELDIEVVEAA